MEISIKQGAQGKKVMGIGNLPKRTRKAIYRMHGCQIVPLAYFSDVADSTWVESFLNELVEVHERIMAEDKARVEELETLHRTYYNQPFAEACQRAASEERERCISKTVETLIAWKVHTLGIPIETIREGIREALNAKN